MFRHAFIAAALLVTGLSGPAVADDASLTIRFTNLGEPLEQPIHAKFYLYELEQRDYYVAWGHAAKTAHFPEGTYDLIIKYKQGEIYEERERLEVELVGDVVEEIDFDIPVARLTIDITSGGRPIRDFTGSFALYDSGQRDKPVTRKRPERMRRN